MPINSLSDYESLFSIDPVETEINVPGTDVLETVYLRPLTLDERDEFELSFATAKGNKEVKQVRSRLLASCWVNSEGKPIGTAAQIGKASSVLLGAVADAALKMNGMGSEKEMVDAGKELRETPD